jgi:hypothetical protein
VFYLLPGSALVMYAIANTDVGPFAKIDFIRDAAGTWTAHDTAPATGSGLARGGGPRWGAAVAGLVLVVAGAAAGVASRRRA